MNRNLQFFAQNIASNWRKFNASCELGWCRQGTLNNAYEWINWCNTWTSYSLFAPLSFNFIYLTLFIVKRVKTSSSPPVDVMNAIIYASPVNYPTMMHFNEQNWVQHASLLTLKILPFKLLFRLKKFYFCREKFNFRRQKFRI